MSEDRSSIAAPAEDGTKPNFTALIIGAGFSGLAAALELRKHGVHDFQILEKHDGVGGTWWINRYPGVGVDAPPMAYRLSAKPFRTHSLFPKGHEVRRYLNSVADDFDLRSKIRLNTVVESATWCDERHLWQVRLSSGEVLSSRFVLMCHGFLEKPKTPDIPGLDSFAGPVVHTARWDASTDYSGKRVGVIGTGASAVQLVPELAKSVERLTVFQRTPIWIVQKPDRTLSPALQKVIFSKPVDSLVMQLLRSAYSLVTTPFMEREWFSRRMTARLVGIYKSILNDAELEAKLIPKYPMGCKRPEFSSEYLQAFKQEHVGLVTQGIDSVSPRGIVTADGQEHPIDVLVLATGFHIYDQHSTPSMPVFGVGGEELGAYWQENGAFAYDGVSTPGWPNLFFVGCGPTVYTFDVIDSIEGSAIHARRTMIEALRTNSTRAELRLQPYRGYRRRRKAELARSNWGGSYCSGANSYYLTYQGELLFRIRATGWPQVLKDRYWPLKALYSFGRRASAHRPVGHDLMVGQAK
ncbi:MAG: flavin-containing monooxygenase [Segniliparus sp.]|uniref:flavin-containing monooxygenase n=1 Tax=Segniliparus sp. TaxID=2804064 RepID=UPI003F3489F6